MAGAGGVYVGGGATVVMDSPSLTYVKLFYDGSGPDRHLKRKVDAVVLLARTLAPVKTGRMKSTISGSRNRDVRGRFAFGYTVSVGTSYGGYVHEGTGPSPRWPDSAKVFRFQGSRGDRVYRDFVMHPGIPSQPFLRNALVAMVG